MAVEPNVLVIVLAGGEGKRLLPLTNDRAKPAVPFAGCYRLIDFALSNFANARYLKIVVLTQYKSHSLDRHISQTWRFSTLLNDYVTPVPAQMRRGPFWFAGSADAIYQNLNLIHDENPDLVCVFGADHIYRMDPRQMVEHHLQVGAGVTVAAIPVPKHEAVDFGVIEVDDVGRILAFHEKVGRPADDARATGHVPGLDGQLRLRHQDADRRRDARRATPTPTSAATSSRPSRATGVAHVYDFSTNVVPGQDERERGYWRDVGTIDAYYEANMDLVAPHPVFNLYNDRWPVYTNRGAEPPAKVSRGPGGEPSYVDGSLLCEGSIISGAHVERSIVAPGVYIDHDAHVTDAILFPGRAGRFGRPAAPLHRRQERADPALVPRRPRRRPRRRALHDQPGRHRRHREGPPPRRLTPPTRVFRAAGVFGGGRPRTNTRARNTRVARQVPARAATTGAKGSTSSPPTMR